MTAAVDSVDNTHITSACILYEETEEAIKWYMNQLVSVCPKLLTELCTVISDKDRKIRKGIRNTFPNATLFICKFHVLQIFRREVTTKRLNTSSIIVNEVLVLLESIVHSKSRSEFQTLCDQLYSFNIESLTQYFQQNWEPIADEWIISISKATNYYGNTTNNRLEAINCRLKNTIKKFSSFDDFFSRFFDTLHSMRIERYNAITTDIIKTNCVDLSNPVEKSYFQLLSSVAFEIVKRELSAIKKENIPISSIPNSCNCNVTTSFSLPCRHILFNRALTLQEIYEPTLCAKRWTKDFLREYLQVNYAPNCINLQSYSPKIQIKPPEKLNSFSKRFRNSLVYSNKYASTTAEYCGEFYDKIVSLLTKIEYVVRVNNTTKVDELLNLCNFLLATLIFYHFIVDDEHINNDKNIETSCNSSDDDVIVSESGIIKITLSN